MSSTTFHSALVIDFMDGVNEKLGIVVILVHSFTLMHSHRWIRYTSDSHLKQMSNHRQTRKSLSGVS